MIDPARLRPALRADWRSNTHTASSRRQRCTNMCGTRETESESGCSARVMDTRDRSIPLSLSTPHTCISKSKRMPLQMLWWSDVVTLPARGCKGSGQSTEQMKSYQQQSVGLVVSVMDITLYSLCDAWSELGWPCHKERKSECIRWVSNRSHVNSQTGVPKSVKIRPRDRKDNVFAVIVSLSFLASMLNFNPNS